MDKNIPVYTLKFDENEEISGVQTISLVDAPAIESNFVALSKNLIKFKGDSFKQYVIGPVLIPDKKILRFTAEGIPYYMMFTAELIEKLRNKYHKQKLSDRTNIDHDANQTHTDIYDIESWIVVDPAKDKSASFELEDIVPGTWMLGKHIPSKEVFQKVLDGEINGFSVEAFLSFDSLIKNSTEVENKNKNQKMEKSKSLEMILSKVEAFFSKLETIVLEEAPAPAAEPAKEDVKKLEDYTLADGKVVSVDEASKIATLDGEPAPAGDHVLEDGRILVIDENSVLVEIKAKPEETPAPEAAKAEEKAKMSAADFKEAFAKVNIFLGQSVYANYTLEDGRDVSLNVVSVNEARVWNAELEVSEVLADGSYPLKDGGELVIEAGKVKSAPNVNVEAPVAAEAELEVEEKLAKVPKTIVSKSNSKKPKDDAPLWERYAYNALRYAKDNN